eukprot:Skav228200  [mRNA]  locus=scaffold704:266537:278731:- [translate_table: standard]
MERACLCQVPIEKLDASGPEEPKKAQELFFWEQATFQMQHLFRWSGKSKGADGDSSSPKEKKSKKKGPDEKPDAENLEPPEEGPDKKPDAENLELPEEGKLKGADGDSSSPKKKKKGTDEKPDAENLEPPEEGKPKGADGDSSSPKKKKIKKKGTDEKPDAENLEPPEEVPIEKLDARHTSQTRLPPKRIFEIREVDPKTAQSLGAPTGPAFDSLFGNAESLLAIHFEKVEPEEVPQDAAALKKSAEALKRLKGLASKPKVEQETVFEQDQIDSLFKPSKDRPVKEKGEQQTAEVQLPSILLKRFIEHAWPQSPNEFMGWIVGRIMTEKQPGTKETRQVSIAEGLFFPKQAGTATNVYELDGDASQSLLKHCEETGSHVIGWIHSHPTFSAFFSSIDQHMQWSIQKDIPLAYGIVVDEHKQPRCLRLTQAGMECVAGCTESGQVMHEHPIPHDDAVEDVEFFLHSSGKKSRLVLHDDNNQLLPLWLQEKLEQLAKNKVNQQRQPSPPDSAGDDSAEQQPEPPRNSFHMQTFQACSDDLAKMKTWLVESFSLCMTSPDDAARAFRALAKSLLENNSAFSEILADLLIDVTADDQINWGELGKQICKLEQERAAIKMDLDAAGPISRRRGRPFGKKNSAKQLCEGEEPDGSEPPSKRAKNSKRKCKRTQADKGKGDLEDEAGAGPPADLDDDAADEQNKSNKCTTIPLHSKCLVVEVAKKLKKDASVHNIEKEVMVRFKKYFFSPELSRWKTGTYDLEKHHLIPWNLLSAKERATMKQLPDWLRRALDLPERFRRGYSLRVPWEVEATFNEVLEGMLAGFGRDLQSVTTLKMPILVKTAQTICDTWKTAMVKDEGVEEPPLRSKDIDGKWVHRFLHRWQWSYQASNTKGAFLADDSQEMNEMRMAHRAQKEIHGCPWELTLNFDQLWRSAYEPPPKVLHKRGAREAKRQGEEWQEPRPDDLCGKRLQAVMAIAKQGLKNRLGQTERASKLRKTCPRTEFVVGGRQSVTAVTSTWASGHIGPLGICVASGSAVELRRAELKMTRETPALLIADGFTGNFAMLRNEDSRRKQFSEENNIVLPIRPPGGWSACGQPCDAWHFQFRKLANLYIDRVLGQRLAAKVFLPLVEAKNNAMGLLKRKKSSLTLGDCELPAENESKKPEEKDTKEVVEHMQKHARVTVAPTGGSSSATPEPPVHKDDDDSSSFEILD